MTIIMMMMMMLLCPMRKAILNNFGRVELNRLCERPYSQHVPRTSFLFRVLCYLTTGVRSSVFIPDVV